MLIQMLMHRPETTGSILSHTPPLRVGHSGRAAVGQTWVKSCKAARRLLRSSHYACECRGLMRPHLATRAGSGTNVALQDLTSGFL